MDSEFGSERIAFADESGTDGSTPCYAIGVVSVAKGRLESFNRVFRELKSFPTIPRGSLKRWSGGTAPTV